MSFDGTGVVITKPLVFTGRNVRLVLNSTGSIKVAILNENGIEMPGFRISDCDQITNSVNYAVSWSNNSDLTAFTGKAIRLKFEMSNSKLYAFEFSNNFTQYSNFSNE